MPFVGFCSICCVDVVGQNSIDSRSLTGKTISIVVLDGCDLMGDPVHLPHVCLPWRNAQERVNRMTHHELPKEARNADLKPRQLYQKIANQVFDGEVSAQARNRKRDALGLRQWWNTIKGVLGDLLGGPKYPRMSELLRALQGCTANARAAIIDVERRPAEPKKLQKKDRDRRYLINGRRTALRRCYVEIRGGYARQRSHVLSPDVALGYGKSFLIDLPEVQDDVTSGQGEGKFHGKKVIMCRHFFPFKLYILYI
ncbi:hypothetical protein TELCIR_08788 [Teladorsagia circumcincta]|uniref:Uncharacterized protein n=1 Tax=Teladorsagia circumcincta TaxID=45464 RepID=A0A2G9UGN4_TELCI|nr:hypothetical protein TELCIR_08788 [Teladorsagia circumcincta]